MRAVLLGGPSCVPRGKHGVVSWVRAAPGRGDSSRRAWVTFSAGAGAEGSLRGLAARVPLRRGCLWSWRSCRPAQLFPQLERRPEQCVGGTAPPTSVTSCFPSRLSGKADC